jgi:PAS domain S-box-containing protein
LSSDHPKAATIHSKVTISEFQRPARSEVIMKTKPSLMGLQYHELLEAAPDAMVVVNAAGEIVLLNVQAERQLGFNRDEMLGQPVKRIIPEGFAERLIADSARSAAEALAQQIGTGIELSARRKNASEFPIEMMLSPLESAEGIMVMAAIRDISRRKAAEKHLGQMGGRYRGLLEAAPDAMVVVNKVGEIVLVNVQAEKRFGYTRDELIGQGVTGSGSSAKIDAAALAPGAYELKGHVSDGDRPGENADCTAAFTVKAFEAPTVGCLADPSSVLSGASTTITATGTSPQNRPLNIQLQLNLGVGERKRLDDYSVDFRCAGGSP